MKGSQNQPPDMIRGVVEGFYGVFYTHPERIDLIRFIGQHGYNLYVYAPKNDRQQRARWWEPYPQSIMAQFQETVRVASQNGVRFCWGVSPGGSLCYSNTQDFNRLTDKMQAFFRIGVRDFSLMLDDNEPGFRYPIDEKRYGSLSIAQASLANRIFAWLHSLSHSCTLSFIPADYSGREPFTPALIDLACRLHPDIDLCYTGPEICSNEITARDARAFARATGRKPLIWDNYPANDLAMQSELHLGPITGRDSKLPGEVKGFLVNPMNQAEASKIALLTFAAYWDNPDHYQPDRAWHSALNEVAGKNDAPALRILAENASNGQKLDHLAKTALRSLRQRKAGFQEFPQDSPALRDLEEYLGEIDEACYALKYRMENLALRNNLLPWIDVLEDWMWLARFGLHVLEHIDAGAPYLKDLSRVYEYRASVQTHPKQIASLALNELAGFVLEQVVNDQRHRLKSATLVGRLS